MSLKDWVRNGWLTEHKTSPQEIKVIRQLDQFRKKRNISDYERAGLISEGEAEEMAILARDLRKKVGAWLKANHPQLLKSRKH